MPATQCGPASATAKSNCGWNEIASFGGGAKSFGRDVVARYEMKLLNPIAWSGAFDSLSTTGVLPCIALASASPY